MSLSSKPTSPPAKRWLPLARAAALLNVDEKTTKRWMKIAARRKALGAVKIGARWKIPLGKSHTSDSELAWELQTRARLEQLGIRLKSDFQKEIEKLEQDSQRNELEAYRLWLAARQQLAARLKEEGRAITAEEVKQTMFLFETACEILKPLPRGADVDKLKAQFPVHLKARGLSDENIRSMMSRWPEEIYLKEVRAAYTLEALETIRRELDLMEAFQTCKHLGRKPTQMNAAPYLHTNLMGHITDISQELPKGVYVGSKPKGISLRTAKRRYPQRKLQQKKTLAEVYDSPDKPPGTDTSSEYIYPDDQEDDGP